MAIRTVVTDGLGNGTYNGTIPLVVTDGFAIDTVIEVDPPAAVYRSRAIQATTEYRSRVVPQDDYRPRNPGEEVN